MVYKSIKNNNEETCEQGSHDSFSMETLYGEILSAVSSHIGNPVLPFHSGLEIWATSSGAVTLLLIFWLGRVPYTKEHCNSKHSVVQICIIYKGYWGHSCKLLKPTGFAVSGNNIGF